MSANDFASVRVVGGLLPPDLLARIISGDPSLGGLTSSDYHLSSGESPREAANRAWAYLLGAWTTYKQALEKLPEGDPAVGLTRERWLTLLFKELDYGRLQQTPPGGLVIDEKSFPVSHLWGATPMHLLGWGVDLDKRTKGVAGAAERAPQAMVQEALNRTNDHLWAILANGKTVRLLRDSTSLAGQAYVEFDLETMFDGEIFSDFALLYLLLHQSRVEVPTDGSPADCWLEKWRTNAAESGTRALGLLRDGVKEAIEALGTGFLQAPGNDLNARLADGSLRIDDYHRSLLRLVYRLLFLCVAEDRGLLLAPDADKQASQRYRDYYSTSRLRSLARKRRGSHHTDLWQALELVMTALGNEAGRPELGLVGLGGIFNHELVDVVRGQQLPNQALLTAVRKLSVVHPKGSPPRVVDYHNLGAEELGGIYESLLELVPRYDQVGRTFTLDSLAGNDRKTSGSYYTPSSLIDLVLDEALEPILDERETAKDPEQALLSITVCDPSCGSGHFLVAAARRIATRLAAIRTGEADPTPYDVQAALYDVVAKCIYGVDLNPMAAELAKVSLWLEAMRPGKPLSFLDAHIKVGNALLGTTPRLLAEGVPDGAYDAIEGDDRKYATALRKRNKAERDQLVVGKQGDLFDRQDLDESNAHLRSEVERALRDVLAVTSLAEVHEAERRYRRAQESPESLAARLRADTWCAAFVQTKVPGAPAITQAALEDPSPEVESEVLRLAAKLRFFHWHLEFPEIFDPTTRSNEQFRIGTGWSGGFTAVVGNPPWDQVQFDPSEFFQSREPAIAEAPNMSARDKLIEQLRDKDPELWESFIRAQRTLYEAKHLIHESGLFPLTSYGRLNTYSLFAELGATISSRTGIAAVVTPTGLMTDAFNRHFASDLLTSGRLRAFYDFENEGKIFPAVHNQQHFAVTVYSGSSTGRQVGFAFYLRRVSDVSAKRFFLSADAILRVNPNTGTLPLFRTSADAAIMSKIYDRFTPLVPEDSDRDTGYGLRFQLMFMMNTVSEIFRTPEELGYSGAEAMGWPLRMESESWIPLYEGKMISSLDHRFATYLNATQAQLNKGVLPRLSEADHEGPETEAVARYFVPEHAVADAIGDRSQADWLLGWRDIASPVNERTFIASLLPRVATGGIWIAYPPNARLAAILLAVWSSFVWDYQARQKLAGSHLNLTLVRQLACPTPVQIENAVSAFASGGLAFFVDRILELAYTSYRLRSLARDLGDRGEPFCWSENRRQALRSEIDAAIFHVYGLDREEVEHVLDSFFVLRKYEERDHGEFRTKHLVLEAYDAMGQAAVTGVPYQTPIDPPPGFGPRHDPSTRPDWLKETS